MWIYRSIGIGTCMYMYMNICMCIYICIRSKVVQI